MQEEVGSVRALAGLAGAGSSLAAAAGKLLDWRQQKCPGRAREPAAALADLRGIFAESWRRLDVTRSSHTALVRLLTSSKFQALDEAQCILPVGGKEGLCFSGARVL